MIATNWLLNAAEVWAWLRRVTAKISGRWVSLFQEAGITAVGLEEYESMKWSKALLNMVGNATSAILAMPPGDVYRDPSGYELEVRMLREILAVMDKTTTIRY